VQIGNPSNSALQKHVSNSHTVVYCTASMLGLIRHLEKYHFTKKISLKINEYNRVPAVFLLEFRGLLLCIISDHDTGKII
jgi:hypothetical protein